MAESTTPSLRPRVLSGMRPTGKLHLGNYMGALHNWVKLQETGQYDCYFFIADWHALTTDYADPSRVKLNTLDAALDWLAAGLNPDVSTIFIQSQVLQHAELHLLFSMITPLGWLERVPTYKEQQENITGKDLSTYGFLGYPLLQSADILIYQAQYVPVGADQVAHVELTREVARRFNSMYRVSVFPEPEALLTPTPKLPGLDGRKMSKSYGNTLELSEPPESIRAKVATMSTGGQRIRQTDPGDPALCPVADLHRVFSPAGQVAEIEQGCRTASIGCAGCKQALGESISAVTGPIYAKRAELEAHIDETWAMLREQSVKAAARAEQTMREVREVFNLSHELGAARRFFGAGQADAGDARDLSAHADWWELERDARARNLRDYWREKLVPRDVHLSQESNRVFATLERELEEPFLTAKKKRVFVSTAREDAAEPNTWDFEVPNRSYEVWTLLCWKNDDKRLHDFVIPQKFYAQRFAQAKKAAGKDGKIPVRVIRDPESDHFFLRVGDAANGLNERIVELAANYEPLK